MVHTTTHCDHACASHLHNLRSSARKAPAQRLAHRIVYDALPFAWLHGVQGCRCWQLTSPLAWSRASQCPALHVQMATSPVHKVIYFCRGSAAAAACRLLEAALSRDALKGLQQEATCTAEPGSADWTLWNVTSIYDRLRKLRRPGEVASKLWRDVAVIKVGPDVFPDVSAHPRTPELMHVRCH